MTWQFRAMGTTVCVRRKLFEFAQANANGAACAQISQLVSSVVAECDALDVGGGVYNAISIEADGFAAPAASGCHNTRSLKIAITRVRLDL